MDRDSILRTVREATHEFYQLGMRFKDAQMIPPSAERSIPVTAGPLRFVVEPRHLDDVAVAANNGSEVVDAQESFFDDFGPSVHVFGALDGLEHLRFDCFADKPHYHYACHVANENITVRIDQFADGDPLDWTLARLRTRLPEMLDYAGAYELATAVRSHSMEVDAAIDTVAELLRAAGNHAAWERLDKRARVSIGKPQAQLSPALDSSALDDHVSRSVQTFNN